MESFFENKTIPVISISSSNLNISWELYWLKSVSYNAELHKSELNQKEHFHSFFEMHAVMQGELTYLVNGEILNVHAGEFILFSPRQSHQLIAHSTTFQKYSIAFSFHLHQAPFVGMSKAELSKAPCYLKPQTAELISPLQAILFSTNLSWEESSLMIQMQLNSFLLALFHSIRSKTSDPDSPPEDTLERNDEMIYQQIVNYLKENVSKKVSMQGLSKAILIGERQITRILERSHQTTFSHLRDEIKCSVARNLLSKNLSLQCIAEAIGMGNEYSFNRFFKRVEGMPPGKFREALRSSNCK